MMRHSSYEQQAGDGITDDTAVAQRNLDKQFGQSEKPNEGAARLLREVLDEGVEHNTKSSREERMNHTPGPWETNTRIHPNDQVFAKGDIVADCKWTKQHPEVREANARLIATAPALLSTLEDIIALDDGDSPDLWHFETAFNKARAVIAQTKGLA
ncbi:MAG: hypothetical protein U0990_09995 [Candidatus Nanopelagicales bacterium]|nr:hypothetical protein [Candidatus Nanopelagicales bacterium]